MLNWPDKHIRRADTVTAGTEHISLTGSTPDAVGAGGNNKAAASVHLHGVQVAEINNNRFNNILNTDLPRVKELNSEKENTTTINNNTTHASKQ